MEIAVIGVSYKNADVDSRGQVAFTKRMKTQTYQSLAAAGINEQVIVSTCNRSEIYIATSHMERDIDTVKQLYQELAGTRILPLIYVKKFELAIGHIFRVAAGLESLVIGEDEILSQLKDAVGFARELGHCKKYLDKVLREAITFSKKVRNAYKLSENKLSVASIGIQFLKDKYPDFQDKRIMLIGTGNMGQLILKYLEHERVANVVLTNRSLHKGKIDFYVDKHVRVIEYGERYAYLNEVDIVISATASQHTVIKYEECPVIDSPITFLDMAVPRDIDQRLAESNCVDIITMDSLNDVVEKHLSIRQDIANQIQRLIYEEVKEIELWILRAKADSVIRGFHRRQADIVAMKREQIDKMQLTESQTKEVVDMLKSCTWQMVKQPVEELKRLKQREHVEHYKMIIENLFRFEGDQR